MSKLHDLWIIFKPDSLGVRISLYRPRAEDIKEDERVAKIEARELLEKDWDMEEEVLHERD